MKIRQGYVSNSSSSSFVILGVKIKEEIITDDIIEELENKFSILYPGEGGAPDGYYVVGTQLAQSEDWGLLESEVSIDKVIELSNDVKHQLTEMDIQDEGIGIFCGTRMS